MTFRSLLPKELLVNAFPLLIEHVKARGVVCTYSACAIEKLVAGGMVDRAALLPHAPAALTALFAALGDSTSPQDHNEYVMKAILRTMSCLQDAALSYVGSALPKLAQLLAVVAKNPCKPHFNHYLFETLSLAVALVTKSNPNAITAFEDALFPIFQEILQNDVQEFMPYVFQMLSLLLELRGASSVVASGDGDAYGALLPCLVAPPLWERPANVRPLVRLLCAFVRARGDHVLREGKLALISLFELPTDDTALPDDHFVEVDDAPGYQAHRQTSIRLINELRLYLAHNTPYVLLILKYLVVLEEEPRVEVTQGAWSAAQAARDIVASGGGCVAQEEPFYVCDLRELAARHARWRDLMPRVEPFYAVKCNDDKLLLRTLAALGTGFDCASRGEIDLVTNLGVAPELVLRIRCDAKLSIQTLGDKFGCDPATEAPALLKTAAVLGLDVAAVINAALETHFPEPGVRVANRDETGVANTHTMYYINAGAYSAFIDVHYYPEKPMKFEPFYVGSWLLFQDMGAYTMTFATNFNGFVAPRVVLEEEPRVEVTQGAWSAAQAARDIVASGGGCVAQEEPFYVCDLRELAARHARWRDLMPRVEPFYAVKCNDDKLLLRTLAALGTGFDCASRGEIDLVTNLGVAPELVLRIRCDAKLSIQTLGDKFGCDPATEAPALLKTAAVLGLDYDAYARGIAHCRDLFALGAEAGRRMRLVDIGGGFPGDTGTSIKEVANRDETGVANTHTMYYINAGAYSAFIDVHYYPEKPMKFEPFYMLKEENHVIVMEGNWSALQAARDIVASGTQEEPFYVCDLRELEARHARWRDLMPRVEPFYAVKCNDDKLLLRTLAALGTGFDCASRGEIDLVTNLGACAAYPLRLDARAAVVRPEVRLRPRDRCARASQYDAYARAIALCRDVFAVAAKMGRRMRLVDIGGGFPGDTGTSIKEVAAVVNAALDTHFPDRGVRVIAEPGRYFAAAAYTLAVMIKSEDGEVHTMYSITDGVYGSFNSVITVNEKVEPMLLYVLTSNPSATASLSSAGASVVGSQPNRLPKYN
ncbi:hypothetical protein MSG28_013615 [Choristoneura fumiferana]|uniref:Uncharacterized protein n=1 Tax=Choristoneura fumiferana TaxID=7141 RepID=A0ACC0K916_CHOFU|nr:hypothetical protein MSG28_013615 [Choristoneura fumiferana]